MDLTLHHIGILVPDIAQAAEQYVNRFGYQIVSEVIHDVQQTAYVQFLKGAEPAYIELIAADGPGSTLSNALKKGGGLNHLCYAVADIDAECRRLRAADMVLLQSPVPAQAFPGRRIAWLMGRDRVPIELVEHSKGDSPIFVDHG